MKQIKTPTSNFRFILSGGTEENDLWVEPSEDKGGNRVSISMWEPTDAECEAIASGKNIELYVWGTGHPPVALGVEE